MFPNALFAQPLFPEHLFPRYDPSLSIIPLSDVLTFVDLVTNTSTGSPFGGPFPAEIFDNPVFTYHVFPRAYIYPGTNVYPISFKDKLNFVDEASYTTPIAFTYAPSDTLEFTQYVLVQLGSNVFSFHDEILFTQDLNFQFPPGASETLSDELVFTDTVETNGSVFLIHLEDILVFLEPSYQKNIGGISITVPILIVSVGIPPGGFTSTSNPNYLKYLPSVILQGPSDVITLPAPLFNNSVQNVASVNINRMISGKVYTNIKTTGRNRLKWKFEVKRQKANEMQLFINANNLNYFYVTDWLGNYWYMRIINNPIIFEAVSRDGTCSQNAERHQFELQLEGYLINAQNVACQ